MESMDALQDAIYLSIRPTCQCVAHSREAERRETSLVFLAMPEIKELHAMIGQQALEIDFSADALGRIGDPSAKL